MKRSWLTRKLASSVTVHLTTGDSIAGYLEEVGRDGVILRAPRFLDAEQHVPMAGELFVPREKVLFVQVQSGVGDTATLTQ